MKKNSHNDPVPVQIDLIPNLNKSAENQGRDELNLAEFPLCSLSGKQQTEDMTLQFTDQIWDDSRGKYIDRMLTVAGTKRHGLPTSIDDEVLLALIQISAARGYPKEVEFSRYEVVNLLRWQHSGKSYHRIEDSINRWTAISLDYENAWREKGLDGEKSSWVDAKFHIIEMAKFHRKDDPNSPDTCMIRWGDYIQKSFAAGNLRKLDFEQFLNFKTGIAKRIYRFIGKRLWHKTKWKFDLKEFAFDKVGMSRKLNVGQIKQRLEKPLQELVAAGFIKEAPREERYLKARVGEWFIVFEGCTKTPKQMDLEMKTEPLPALEEILVKRGVTAVQAKRLGKSHDHDFIREKVEILDFSIGKGGGLAPKNPGGWLVNAIRDDYEAPPGFKSTQQKLREASERKKKEKVKSDAATKKTAEIDRLQAEMDAQDARIEQHLANLSKTKRAAIENEAKAEAQKQGFGLGLDDNSVLMKHYVLETIKEIVLGHLGEVRVEVPER